MVLNQGIEAAFSALSQGSHHTMLGEQASKHKSRAIPLSPFFLFLHNNQDIAKRTEPREPRECKVFTLFSVFSLSSLCSLCSLCVYSPNINLIKYF